MVTVRSVDHLVLAGPDLSEAVAYATELLGASPEAGGAHPGLGSRNALLGLGSGAYLEVIGPDPDQPQPPQPRPFGIDQLSRPTFVTCALRADRLTEQIARFSSAQFTPARAMQRRKTDGVLLEWELAVPVPHGTPPVQPVPFLIDWGEGLSPGQVMSPSVRLVSVTVTVGSDAEHSAVTEVLEASASVENEGVPVDVVTEAGAQASMKAMIETADGVVELS